MHKLLYLFFGALILSMSVHHSSFLDLDRRPSSEPKEYDKIYSFCGSTQGNGYNWAATLGWLSEQVYEIANRAKYDESEGQKVAISLSCFAGGSSGSGVAIVFDSLLKNKNLNTSYTENWDGIMKVSDAFNIAEALKRISFSVDLESFYMKLDFALESIGDRVSAELLLKNIKTEGETPNLWDEYVEGKIPVADFGHIALFSLKAKKEFLNFPLKLESFSELKESSRLEVLNHTSHKLENYLTERVDDELTGSTGFARRHRRDVSGITPNPDNSPNKGILAHFKNAYRNSVGLPLEDGIFTIALSALYENQEELKKTITNHVHNKVGVFEYPQGIRIFNFQNLHTAKLISESESYKKALEAHPFLKRHSFAVVKQRWAALNSSIREPGLTNELSGTLNSKHLRIKQFFDPQNDEGFFETDSSSKAAFIIGGFPFKEHLAFLPLFYQKAKRKEFKDLAYQVVETFHLFGSPKSGFATKQMNSILFGVEEKSAQESRNKDWRDWSESFYDLVDEVELYITDFDWDQNKTKGKNLPAAIAGKSALLSMQSIKVSRDLILEKKHPRAFQLQPLWSPEPTQ